MMTEEHNITKRRVAKAPCSSTTRVREGNDYLSFVEALQRCLLARCCTVSVMRFDEASVEESSERT